MPASARIPLLLLTVLVCAQSAPVFALQLAPCTDRSLGPRAECGRQSVFEDRASKAGRKIDIAFAVLRAQHPDGREPVFMFAGGPGQGSTELGGVANGPFISVRERRDVVLVDQRGSGGSNGLTCAHDVERDPQSAFGHVFDPELFRKCLAEYRTRADLRFYTSELAAQDVDDIRARLGYERVILWGGSYGTRLAQTYMRRFPQRVAAAVLDGVVPFDLTAPLTYAASAQRSLDRVLADCHADAECDRANADAGVAFGRVVARLQRGPVDANIRRRDSSAVRIRLSLGDFGYAVRGVLYNSDGGRALPAMIHRADSTGDLSEFAQRYWRRAAGFQFSRFADGLHFAVICAEDASFIRDGDVAQATRGTFLGRYLLDEYRNVCRDWTRAPLVADAREPLRSDVPTLLLSGWFDPVTPPEKGERVAQGLSHVRHVVVRNEAHGSGIGCALRATLYVLREGKVDGMPEVCGDVKGLDW